MPPAAGRPARRSLRCASRRPLRQQLIAAIGQHGGGRDGGRAGQQSDVHCAWDPRLYAAGRPAGRTPARCVTIARGAPARVRHDAAQARRPAAPSARVSERVSDRMRRMSNPPSRLATGSHARFLLCLLALATVLRALVPVGYMPDAAALRQAACKSASARRRRSAQRDDGADGRARAIPGHVRHVRDVRSTRRRTRRPGR